LYLLFKTFSKEYINMLLTAYFLLIGFISLTKTFGVVIRNLFGLSQGKYILGAFTIPRIPYVFEKPIPVKFGVAEIISWVLSAIVVYAYLMTKGWILNNVLGLSFCIQGISLLSLGNYLIGCTLLGGLFFYDIFWVFGTDVMVTVAKNFDAPIKLLFPKDIFADVFEFSMLGLGDIVIPGVFIALLLRYDAFRATKGKTQFPVGQWGKPYFYATFFGYILGLGTTIFVMHTFRAAQPALLYLVPTCVGFSFGTAFVLGDLKGLLAYSEDTTTEAKVKIS